MATLATTEALEKARLRRAELYDALKALERAAAAPVSGRRPEWRAQLRAAVEELERSFDDHISVTEGADGLLEEVQGAAPHLTGRISRLLEDHARIREEIHQFGYLVRDGVASEEELRAAVLHLFTRLSRHRQEGSDLVYEAYNVDIGTTD